MDTAREQLKTHNSQFSFFIKQKVAAKTNLISLLDNTYPCVNILFDSSVRDDSSTYVDYVRKTGLKVFTVHYEAFCKKHHYNYQKDKPVLLFKESKQLIAAFRKENLTAPYSTKHSTVMPDIGTYQDSSQRNE